MDEELVSLQKKRDDILFKLKTLIDRFNVSQSIDEKKQIRATVIPLKAMLQTAKENVTIREQFLAEEEKKLVVQGVDVKKKKLRDYVLSEEDRYKYAKKEVKRMLKNVSHLRTAKAIAARMVNIFSNLIWQEEHPKDVEEKNSNHQDSPKVL
jgi:hypothetical protein